LIFIFAFVILWRLINFANKNPQAALLEGAEFLVHEQIELAAKGIPVIPVSTITTTQEFPFKIDKNFEKAANKPEEEGKDGKNA